MNAKKSVFSRGELLLGAGGMGLAMTGRSTIAKNRAARLDNNHQVVDLTDLQGDLPLDVSSKQILKQTATAFSWLGKRAVTSTAIRG